MTLFERHILIRLVLTFVALTSMLVVFFILLHYVEYVDDFVDRGATMSDVFLTYYPSFVPEIIRLISPAAVFLSTVFVTGKLAQQLQLMALYSSGVSLYRLMVPYLGFGVLVAVSIFFFNGWVVPGANITRIAFEEEYLGGRPDSRDAGLIHRQIGPQTLLTVGYYDRTLKIAHRVSVQQFTGETLEKRLDAQQMQWIDSLETWRFTTLFERTFGGNTDSKRSVIAAMDSAITLYPTELLQTENDLDLLTLPEAEQYINSLQRIGSANLGLPLVKYYGKFSYPFANIIVVFLGLALASDRKKGGQAIQMAIALFTAFTYLAFILISEPFGYSGTISPLTAVLAPHILFLLLGVVLLKTVRK